MKNNNRHQYNQQQRQSKNIFLLSYIALSIFLSTVYLLSIATIDIDKVQAISSTITNNNTTTVRSLNNNEVKSLGIIESPFYESDIGKVIGQRIISSSNGSPQMEQSIVESGVIKGVGNVTNLQTWIDTFKSSSIFYGSGQGIITTPDGQMATWTGYDTGRSNNNGIIIYHGITFFDTNSTGKLAFLKNIEGLHTTEVDGNKQMTKIWQWK
jgi:hypothetical protein